MALSKILKDLIAVGEGHYQEEFGKLRDDVKIAIYQKLLFKAGETPEGSDARKALKSIDDGFEGLDPEVRKGIEIERKRYATAKANAIYQDYLYQKVLEKVTKGKDPVELQNGLMFEPQGRLVYELTLTIEEQEEVLKKIEGSLSIESIEGRHPIDIKQGLKQVLGGRTPTDTTLCSIDLSGPRLPEKGAEVYKKLQEEYKKIYGGQRVLRHQRASIVASFEETYAHMCLMAGTFERRSITYGDKNTISKKDWQDIRHKAALKLQDEVAKVYKKAVKNATDSNGKVDVDKLNKNLAKERVRLAQSAKKILIEGVVAHLKEHALLSLVFNEEGKLISGKLTKKEQKDLLQKRQDLVFDEEGKLISGELTKEEQEDLLQKRRGLVFNDKGVLTSGELTKEEQEDLFKKRREYVLEYTQKLSSSLNKHKFTAQTATGFDYFYTSNYLQQGMLITGTQHTAHEKPSFIPGQVVEDQAAFRRVTYTYRDEKGALHPTTAVSARIPSPALVFHPSMSAQDIKDDLVKKFGFLHEQMRAMRGGKNGPVVENLFTSFHSEAFETIGDNNNKQRASALYMIQAMHDFNTPWSIRVKKLEKQLEKLVEEKPAVLLEEQLDMSPEEKLTAFKTQLDQLEEKRLLTEEEEQYKKKLDKLGVELENAREQALIQAQERLPKNNFLYVQNIGTNRHTRDLGYRDDRSMVTGSVELDDITLSAEMAMLHTLQENSAYLSQEVKDKITNINAQVLEHYHTFLNEEQRPTYFAESEAGKNLIKEIRAFKKGLESDLSQEDVDDLPLLASNALVRMIATNQHWDVRYGQLSQALSMYIEWASTGGCKSGNERNQDVMLRFALLKSIHERVEHAGNTDGLQDHERAIYEQLKAYAKGQTADPDDLRAAIAVSVSKCNLHGGAAAISREDQGGAAKVSSFSFVQDIKNPFLRWTARIGLGVFALATAPLLLIPAVRKFYISQLIDTNNAADREMNLDATGASKTQAHKGQDKRTREVILEVLKEDEFFNKKKGGTELTSEEKAGFKKTKGSHERYELSVKKKGVEEGLNPLNGSPQLMVKTFGVTEVPKPKVEAAQQLRSSDEPRIDDSNDRQLDSSVVTEYTKTI
ncbi:hypothetical protein [Legionella bozemanae]|uniref:Uncharacterized protein n=1 Tax=Legionella bozemanae TaxID=447 RepID=A0A0W0RQH0_LEGBO|nr:hypothetical protein [Legionella bozemanae]KTC73328.1 hypothetical protein Lboz_1974 [Legionella bozemanae]STO35653.1 Uncharacterised protein [Legionella bozemanae]